MLCLASGLIDLCGEVLPLAELTVFHIPQFDAVAKPRATIGGLKRALIGDGDPIAVDATARLSQSEVAHGWKHGLPVGEVGVATLHQRLTVQKDLNVGVESFPEDFDVLVGVGRHIRLFKALCDLLCFFAIHALSLIQLRSRSFGASVGLDYEGDSGTPNPVASLNQDLHLYGSPYRWLGGTGVGVPEFSQ